MNVEVKHTEGFDLPHLSRFVSDEQVLLSDLQQAIALLPSYHHIEFVVIGLEELLCGGDHTR